MRRKVKSRAEWELVLKAIVAGAVFALLVAWRDDSVELRSSQAARGGAGMRRILGSWTHWECGWGHFGIFPGWWRHRSWRGSLLPRRTTYRGGRLKFYTWLGAFVAVERAEEAL